MCSPFRYGQRKKLLAFSGFYDCEGPLATSHIANPLASNMLDEF